MKLFYTLILITHVFLPIHSMELTRPKVELKGAWTGLNTNRHYQIIDGKITYTDEFHKHHNELKKSNAKRIAAFNVQEKSLKIALNKELAKADSVRKPEIQKLINALNESSANSSDLGHTLTLLCFKAKNEHTDWQRVITQCVPLASPVLTHTVPEIEQKLEEQQFTQEVIEGPLLEREPACSVVIPDQIPPYVEEIARVDQSNTCNPVQEVVVETLLQIEVGEALDSKPACELVASKKKTKKKKKQKKKALIVEQTVEQLPLQRKLPEQSTPTLPSQNFEKPPVRFTVPERPTLAWPFQNAVINSQYELVEKILRLKNSGINIDLPIVSAGPTPLHYAALKPDVLLMRILLDRGANPNTLNSIILPDGVKHKVTPLALAVSVNSQAGVELLLQHKADTDILLEYDATKAKVEIGTQVYIARYVLDVAATPFDDSDQVEKIETQKNIVRSLLLSGATKFSGRIYFCDPSSETGYPIELGSRAINILMRYMLAPTTNIICLEHNIYLVPDDATYNRVRSHDKMLRLNTFIDEEDLAMHEQALQLLLAHCIDKKNSVKLDKFLTRYKKGVNLDTPMIGDQFSPLHKCIMNHKLEMCRVLLKHGANPCAKNYLVLADEKYEATTLPFAFVNGDVKIIELLLKHGLDPNEKAIESDKVSESALTLLMTPYYKEYPFTTPETRKDLIKILLLAGATEFKYQVYMCVPTEGKKYPLNLNDPDDQAILTYILAPEDGVNHIICEDDGSLLLEYVDGALLTTEITSRILSKPIPDNNE